MPLLEPEVLLGAMPLADSDELLLFPVVVKLDEIIAPEAFNAGIELGLDEGIPVGAPASKAGIKLVLDEDVLFGAPEGGLEVVGANVGEQE